METFGLALEVGGAHGLAHLRAFRALEDLRIFPSVTAGTSMGTVDWVCCLRRHFRRGGRRSGLLQISNRSSMMIDNSRLQADTHAPIDRSAGTSNPGVNSKHRWHNLIMTTDRRQSIAGAATETVRSDQE